MMILTSRKPSPPKNKTPSNLAKKKREDMPELKPTTQTATKNLMTATNRLYSEITAIINN